MRPSANQMIWWLSNERFSEEHQPRSSSAGLADLFGERRARIKIPRPNACVNDADFVRAPSHEVPGSRVQAYVHGPAHAPGLARVTTKARVTVNDAFGRLQNAKVIDRSSTHIDARWRSSHACGRLSSCADRFTRSSAKLFHTSRLVTCKPCLSSMFRLGLALLALRVAELSL